jgi:hypothetical protein
MTSELTDRQHLTEHVDILNVLARCTLAVDDRHSSVRAVLPEAEAR